MAMATPPSKKSSDGYSASKGFIFIFNLIVGAGALNIPQAFSRTGVLYGTLIITIIAFTSYVTTTFVVELMAGLNALLKIKKKPSELEELGEIESAPLLNENSTQSTDFEIIEKIEFAEMAEELLSQGGLVLFYLCVTIYLFGDLAIYATAVPKSLRELTCPAPHPPHLQVLHPWECIGGFNSSQVYRIYVLGFVACLGPFAFCNLQKTQLMQLLTTVMRHMAFLLMILIALSGIWQGEGRQFEKVIAYENPASIPTLFGVCIYSFMCHHSLPGLITPIADKRKVGVVLASSVSVVLIAYLILCLSATFRFKPTEIHDVYTLNFNSLGPRLIALFLNFFPVFTLSANFPLIAITLRENLKTLFAKQRTAPDTESIHRERAERGNRQQHIYAALAITPPLLIALYTENVSMLVGFTGAYAGLGIQWVIPAILVHKMRLRLRKHGLASDKNMHRSPFYGNFWINLTLCMAVCAIVVVTATHVFMKTANSHVE